jgi:murein DD-endopeptidase MepM/ murein hydrolase activator NlpD
MPGEPAHLWLKLSGVAGNHRFMVKTYRGPELITRRHTYWRKADQTPKNVFFTPTEYATSPGTYRSELFLDTGDGFELVAERSFEVDVLSPVRGPVERNCVWPSDPEVWAFCKHRRARSRGVASADDTRAWDLNLPRYADAGKPVYPVAPGRVVRYGGDVLPGGGPMAGVLVEHTTPGGTKWWSGYLHMRRDSIKVRVGQAIEVDTVLGAVGRTGASNNHLHVAIYSGTNTTRGLKSMDVAFRARDGEGSKPVVAAKQRDGRRQIVR